MSLKWAQSAGLIRSKCEHVQWQYWLILSYALIRFITSTSVYQRCIVKPALNQLSAVTEKCIPIIYRGIIPDFIIRWGIRLQLRDHLLLLKGTTTQDDLKQKMNIVQNLRQQPIAIATTTANEQHYEVPSRFYDLCLGPCRKYSSGYWPSTGTTFPESEIHMLELYCERAELQDGMKIVDLGCGWGSLTLFLAAQYPAATITAISNSHSQREFILKTAAERNLTNIQVITCNVAEDTEGVLHAVKDNDRVLTIEMFEHMKNYQQLLDKVQGFLKPATGKLFVHIFTHKDYAYHFEQGSWMSDNFFTGGTMPSDDLLLYFACQDFTIQQHWRVNGQHYEKTSNAWLATLDTNWRNGKLRPVLQEAYGVGREREWYVNWRLFFLACAELWGYDQGNEWIVSHYLFQKK